jgi:hypothetical protein
MKRINPRKTLQSGQAMVEFLVSTTTVMGVLLLGIVMLGKFNDVRNRTLMGARYVAWERTVWSDTDPMKNTINDPNTIEGWSASYGAPALTASKTDLEIRQEVLQRFMGGDNSTLSNSDRKLATLPATRPAMWDDYSGEALLASAADVDVSTTESSDPSSSQTTAAVAPFRTPGSATMPYAAQLSLPTSTLQSGTLSVSVGQNNTVLKSLWPKDGKLAAFNGLTFTDTNVLLANTWVPDGTDSNKAVFSAATPAANQALIQPGVYQGMQKYAPEITTLQFGRIQQDVVPPNRLSQ